MISISWKKKLANVRVLQMAGKNRPLMSRIAHDDKNGGFGERAARLTILAKLAILAIFCQFRQISSSIGIDTTRVKIGDFGDFDKYGNFGNVLPISSNKFIYWYLHHLGEHWRF